MARIRITAEPFGNPDSAVVFDERIGPSDIESDHYAAALVERIGWALLDADTFERDRRV